MSRRSDLSLPLLSALCDRSRGPAVVMPLGFQKIKDNFQLKNVKYSKMFYNESRKCLICLPFVNKLTGDNALAANYWYIKKDMLTHTLCMQNTLFHNSH